MKAIRLEYVYKRYYLNQPRGLKEALVGLFTPGKNTRKSFWALNDVSFEVEEGDILGIVGPNGAGKSTILKLLSGITTPTKGHLEVNGLIGALINLGAGFHPELTGRENIYLYGSIMGLKKAEIHRHFDEIVDFAELGEFIDTPVKRYSSGMFVRLGFATAIHTNPKILLIDEVLAVGDFRFQDKCITKIRELRNKGITMVVVSHQRHTIEKLCQRAIFLEQGTIKYIGKTDETLNHYFNTVFNKGQGVLPSAYNAPEKERYEDREIHITNVCIVDKHGRSKELFFPEDELYIRIYFQVHADVASPVFYARIFKESDMKEDVSYIHGTETEFHQISYDFHAKEKGIAEVHYSRLNLLNGRYFFNVGVLKNVLSTFSYDQREQAAFFTVTSTLRHGVGTIYLSHEWRVSRISQCRGNCEVESRDKLF
jgi:ABC-type polysaccharide/polyol phosphate transport system ATPase subunit